MTEFLLPPALSPSLVAILDNSDMRLWNGASGLLRKRPL